MFQFDKKYLKYFDQNIIIGVSGGADSMFLLYQIIGYFQAKNKKPDNITVLTCNHGTRLQSKSDCLFVKNFCDQNKIECIIKTREDTIKKDEKSLRERRHKVFLEIANQKSADLMFFGHNLTDRFESTILNMARGCRKDGFIGIKDVDQYFLNKSITVVRPLINLTKSEIFKLCKKHKIKYVQDDTNFESSISKRNFVRNDIFPLFGQISNKKTDGTLKFWDSVREFYKLLDKSKNDEKNNFELNNIEIIPQRQCDWGFELVIENDISKKVGISDLVYIAKDLLFYKNVSQNILKEICDFWNKSKSGYKYRNGVYFFVSHSKRYLIKAKKNFRKNTENVCLSKSFRYPKIGDKFKGLTLNKYLIKNKVPIFYREFIKVYEKDGKIIRIEI